MKPLFIRNKKSSAIAVVVIVSLALGAIESRQSNSPSSGDFRILPKSALLNSAPSATNARISIASASDSAGRLSAIDEGLSRLENEFRHATAMGDARARDGILTDALRHWAEVNPIDALKLTRELNLEMVSNAVFEDIAQIWAERDFPAALAWASNETGGGRRDRLLARLAFICSKTRPYEAATLVVQQIASRPTQEEAASPYCTSGRCAISTVPRPGRIDFPQEICVTVPIWNSRRSHRSRSSATTLSGDLAVPVKMSISAATDPSS